MARGAWLAPTLLKIPALHLKCVKATVISFGYPIGALTLAIAAVCFSPPSMLTRTDMSQVERALSLYEVMGNDTRNESEASSSKKSSNYRFDNKPWGIVTSNYAESTSHLSKNRWVQIVQGAAEYFGENMASSTSKLLSPAFGDEVDAHRSIAVRSDDDDEEGHL